MSCPELERLQEAGAVDAHLASCPECRRLLEALAAGAVPPDPARRARLAAVLSAPRARPWAPLAAAAALLLAIGGGLWLRNRPAPPSPPDWRLAWLEERPLPDPAGEGGGKGASGAPGMDSGFGGPGAPRGPGGLQGGSPPLRGGKGGVSGGPKPGALLWLPPGLPEGMRLLETRTVRPAPGREATVLVVIGGGRRLILFEEPGGHPLPPVKGWRVLEMERDSRHVSALGEGFSDAEWIALSR